MFLSDSNIEKLNDSKFDVYEALVEEGYLDKKVVDKYRRRD